MGDVFPLVLGQYQEVPLGNIFFLKKEESGFVFKKGSEKFKKNNDFFLKKHVLHSIPATRAIGTNVCYSFLFK